MNRKSNHKVWLVFVRLLGMETEQERQQLDEIVVPNSKEKLLLDEMSSREDYSRRRQMIANIDVESELERVMRPRRRRLPVLLGRVAAVLLPLLLGGTAIYVMYSKNNASLKNVISLHDVEPGTLEAVLVTSDGTLRELQTAGNHINEKDGSKIMVDSARLNYQDNRPESVRELIYNKLLVGRGHEYMLILNDGTRVWMNSKSELSYPVAFGENVRRVRLSGEAYFEVAKDSVRPFIVEVDRGFEVKVLGTHFNIKAYDTDDSYETTLVEGKVQVSQGNKTKITLEPSEQMVIGKDGRHEVRVVNTSYYTAWHEGWFYFNDESLEQVLTMIGRWYDVDFVFVKENLKEITVTGKLKRFENLSVILKMLERTTGTELMLKNRIVKVDKKK
ncbi:FecR family protein [Butyricimonas faecihominis]|uniref:FecR family protein n=1 Tax=Butyricimonas faecihominis TaxID=1472416 RepID=UPI00266F5158|nr:FecR domain-containing protein [Butyricimonas faecihominis]